VRSSWIHPLGLETALTRSREEHQSRPIILNYAHPDQSYDITRRLEHMRQLKPYETRLLLNDRFAVVVVEPQDLFLLVTFEERSL
jgi:hypothetical protein